MTNKKQRIYKFVSVFTALVMTVIAIPALIGCSLFDLFNDDFTVSFTRSSISLSVGETYNLSNIIEADTRSYTLKSQNTSVATVSGNTLTARGVGITYVVISAGSDSDELKVTVNDGQPDTLELDYDGELIQTMGKLSPVSFSTVATGAIATSNVIWSVNGKLNKMLEYYKPFEFVPSAAGEYIISAKAGSLKAEQTVRVYYETECTVAYDGELEQSSAPYSNVVFTVNIENNSLNPPAYVEFSEDGKTIYAGGDTEYAYKPTAGRHTVSVNVNGNRVYNIDVVCIGSIIPSAPTVLFDNMYPHVYVCFDVAGDAQVEISSSTGTYVFSQADSRYASLFNGGKFDAAGYIDVCASSASRKAYRIRVRSLGDGDILTESEYSEPYTFTQLPQTAKTYVETRCLDGDLYVTSAEEYTAIAEYYINFRSKTTSRPRVSFNCYIAYELDGSASDLWNDAFPIAATSGLYSQISVTLKNNIMSTSFTVNTVNNPTRQAVPGIMTGSYTDQLHAVLPHINYDESKYRAEDYVFPIDEREYSVSVRYSDELYLAAQRGVKPVPVANSTAETLYAMAKSVLRQICTDDMTDKEKAHAIYDWIMWKVAYDTPATASDAGEAYSAYYLEGVFADGTTSIGGVVYTPYAVCDGMSKAYALMCNIEGIPCVRVVGTAGDSLDDAGGHAWNKVFADGAWYIVDCTWGDSVGSLALDGGRAKDYELGLHDHLFVTDAQVATTHFEPYQANESSIIYVPKTTSTRYSVYEDMTYDGVRINSLIRQSENQLERVREIARQYAEVYKSKSTVHIPGGTNGGEYPVKYQGIEIYADGGVALTDRELEAAVTQAVKAVNSKVTAKVFTLSDIILILISG